MELHFEKLSKILNNLSKAPTRRYRNSTLIAKLHEAKQVYNAAIIEIELYKESEQLQLLKNLRYLYGEAYTKLTARLDNNIEPLSFKNLVNVILTINKLYRKVKMANTLDLSLAIRVVGKYDGDAAELENWLNDVTVLREGQTNVEEATFVKFMNNRLSGAARGTLAGIATIAEARNTLRSRFGIKLTPVAVTAELRGLKQKDTNKTDRYVINDLVLVRNETGSKLEQKFDGPYKVLEDLCVNLKIQINNKIDIIHKNRVRKFI
uniref:(northern house mosquito) hypothetical protein n=1 Tax=Culex pipiens TaxID=7175 RepID=A0A8D8AV99_CULPI